ALSNDTFICDTPGFTAIDIEGIEPENLILYFDELVPFSLNCRFSNCAHMKEQDCAVKQAVRDGLVSRSRYLAYRSIHTLLEENKKY
ncbi:MAG: ribosome small subunit-dependent GTPase A, partial [Lachnospiraceae bacterium]|nr:ribosome small subunit-dependent GTPase A [Lachnospiraceae bacterium]